tara:strand:+ start:301 stop:4647 length:4347 start_codon:yes stop_codon:yes gene_type:complete
LSKKLLPITFSILFIVSCGGGGGGGGGPSTPTTPAPTVNLSAEPTSVLLESTSTLTWSSTNATSCSASWTSQTGTSGSEAVTITAAGNNSFSITCTGDGGSKSASVTIEGYRETDGVVVDGYISGAEVCIDEDENWICDSNENSTTSDNEGKFTIRYANGNLVSIGGTDLDSQTLLDNLLITHKLTGHSDFKAVTPVTSVAAFMEDASLVNAALGIDSSIDVFTFDPVANKGDGGINDYLYEKGNQLTVLAFALQNITNNLNTTTETTQDYFKAITEEIEKEYTETETKVDIETEAFVTKALDNVIAAKSVTIDETEKANTSKALASVLPVIEVKPYDDLTIGVIRFAVSTLQTDIQAIANGTATAETVTSYTSDVLAYIAEDQNIDADEIAPDISAIEDTASASEDTAVTINVVANDSYLTSAPISVTSGNATNGITTIAESSPEQIVYTPDTDFNGTDTFSYTITQGDKTSSADVTVTIEAVNDAPSIDIASTIQVEENQTAVTTVAVSDVDEDELTLTLGGTDADSFNLSDENVLTFKEAPDYETKTSYSITLTLTDGTETVTKDITIAITNVNDIAPVFTSESAFSVEENQDVIGIVTATDEEGDDIIFSVSGSELVITSSGELTFVSTPDYESKPTYTAVVTASDGVNSSTQDITINILDVDELSTANDCNYVVNDASTGEFRYCWEEAQSTSGSEYSANVVEPLTITFADESIEIPAISYAEKLYIEYGIVLESSEGDWTNDQAYAIYQTLKKIPQNVRNEANDRRVFSKWALTDLQIQDDISFDKDATNIEVTIESSVFENANPRIATVDGKKGIYFSNKLHNALVRYVTNGGNDTSAVNKILVERYGVTTSIDDYVALTGEQATRFQDFQAEELVAIISMFEEMPSGYHKIEGLDYLVRRINGADNPYYPEAPAIAWDGSGYIEFMEKAFNTVSIDYLHRLILHEKAHFLWAKIFDDELKNNWIELGGWYECAEKESGWCTTKQTEFVSAYAHLKNPNEDMAESLSYFIVNPDALKSRSLAKYEFVRDRIMQGNIYISQIQENLTFKVYNLYPDYVFPGKVKKLFVSVDGAPTEDKTVTVEIQLHALDKILEGAAWARMRIFSTADTYFDLYLYPQNGQNLDTTLRGTYTLSKYAKSGFWKTSQLVLSDEVGNLRMEGANDFGWRMFVNNPNEDLDKPLYIANSMTLTKSLTTIENQEVDVITALWDIDEAFPRENQGCYGALNDENPSTYSLQKYSPQTYSGNYEAGKCFLEYIMPSYMPSGTYRLNYIKMIDEAGNESRNYFASPSGVDTGDNFAGDQLDELAKEVVLETSNPDITAPELDLNNISINATPTNPDNPNGETIVKFTFRVKDDISGYKLGYYTFRDPQGLTSGYYHYPERRSEIFPTAEDLDWYEYTSTVILPAGSAPGTWGVVELTLRDRALNFKTYNFTEIISFQTE